MLKERKKSHDEIAREGGLSTLRKYGKKHFIKIAKDRWEKKKNYQSKT